MSGSSRENATRKNISEQRRSRAHLTSGTYFERYRTEPALLLSVYADMIKLKSPMQKPIHTPDEKTRRRGNVRGFSKRSRKRLIEFMARVRLSGAMFFVTLTYPDVFPVEDPEQWDRHFEAFRDRFERRFPTYRAIWRKEFQDRKSGLYKGQIAPHFHLIIFTNIDPDTGHMDAIADTLYGELSPMWHEVVNSYDPEHLRHGAHVAAVRSRKHAYAYVSKYVAKIEDDNYEFGRRWGRIGRFNTDPSIEIMLNREEYFQLRRIIKRWLKKRGRKYWRRFARQNCAFGCTVFGLGDGQTDEEFNEAANWIQFLHAAKCHAENIWQ